MTKTIFDKVTVCNPQTGYDGIATLIVENGIIAALDTPQKIGELPADGDYISGNSSIEGNAILTSGFVDIRVQSRFPGHRYQETPHSLALAAASGGITSLVCLPNTEPVLDNPDGLQALTRHGFDKRWGFDKDKNPAAPRFYAYGAATQGLDDKAMAELGLLAEAGAVGFTNGIKPIADSLMMRRVMDYAAMFGKPVIQHAEDPSLAAGGEMNEGEMSTRLGLKGIPPEAEEIMIARDLSIARMTGAHYHVAHISTGGGIDLIRRAKSDGMAVSCDTAPPYFALNDLAVEGYDTRFCLSPPLRSEDDRQAVLAGLIDGTIDCIASDHAPQDRDAKLLPFGLAAAGSSALETLLPLTLGLYHAGHISLMRAFELISASPARLLGLPCGSLEVGSAADMAIINPSFGGQIRGGSFHSLSHSTPFEGHPIQGKVLSTWVGGEMIFGADTSFGVNL